MRSLLAGLAAGLAALALAGHAAAATGSLVGLRPADPSQSWIVLELAPGASAVREAEVVNLSELPQAVRVSAADATTTDDGVFTLAGEAEPRRGVGAWVAPGARRLELAPGERRRVAMRVGVPAGTPPGDYAGGLVVSPEAPVAVESGGGVAVRVQERIGLRVYVTVPGTRDGTVRVEGLRARPTPAGGVRGALGLAGGLRVAFRAVHAGNVRYTRLHARVELLEGTSVIAVRPLDLGTLLPGGSRAAAVDLPLDGWSPGDYRVRVTVGALPEARAEVPVGIGTGRLYAAGGLGLGLLVVGGAGMARRRRRAP